MNIVDSSGWLEYFAYGPNADFFASAIEDTSELVVPSISMYEVFKWKESNCQWDAENWDSMIPTGVENRALETKGVPYSKDLNTQIGYLERVVKQNEAIGYILKLAPRLQMPNWYLGAGCIAQTVWNVQHGFDLTHGIEDYDLVYYDSSDTSYRAEEIYIKKGKELFEDIPGQVEIRNQARVHLWYEKHFGYAIEPYDSVEDAINTWPTTATSVAIKYDEAGFIVYAPYGLNDLFGMIVRPNKVQITEDIYLRKVERWTKIWYRLKVIPWDQ